MKFKTILAGLLFTTYASSSFAVYSEIYKCNTIEQLYQVDITATNRPDFEIKNYSSVEQPAGVFIKVTRKGQTLNLDLKTISYTENKLIPIYEEQDGKKCLIGARNLAKIKAKLTNKDSSKEVNLYCNKTTYYPTYANECE